MDIKEQKTASDIVVIGASAGGVEALIQFCRLLPGDMPAAIFVVLHTSPNAPGVLPVILQRYCAMTVKYPQQVELIQQGTVYLAPPNRHMILDQGGVRLTIGPRENLLRPSIDTLFRSAAYVYGPRVIGVVLSGTRSDGTAGLQIIQQNGGLTMVQDPKEALFPGMPKSAIQALKLDYVLGIAGIVEKLVKLVHLPIRELKEHFVNDQSKNEKKVIRKDFHEFENDNGGTQHSIITCPECGGVLWEMHEGHLVRYVCHVGHSYSEDSLSAGQSEALEEALWVAVRALEERAALSRRLATRATTMGQELSARQFLHQAAEAEKGADLVRSIVMNGKVTDPGKEVMENDREE